MTRAKKRKLEESQKQLIDTTKSKTVTVSNYTFQGFSIVLKRLTKGDLEKAGLYMPITSNPVEKK